jgi:hypothetical protein
MTLINAVWGHVAKTVSLMLNQVLNITTLSVTRLNDYSLTSRHVTSEYIGIARGTKSESRLAVSGRFALTLEPVGEEMTSV